MEVLNMSCRVIWDNEDKTIIRHIFYNKFAPEDFYYAVHENVAMLATVDHPVDLILDYTQTQIRFMKILQLARYSEQYVPDNQRLVVLVGKKDFFSTMINIIRRFTPKSTANMYFVDTMIEAYTIIEKHTISV
jgi:hypothetical protein